MYSSPSTHRDEDDEVQLGSECAGCAGHDEHSLPHSPPRPGGSEAAEHDEALGLPNSSPITPAGSLPELDCMGNPVVVSALPKCSPQLPLPLLLRIHFLKLEIFFLKIHFMGLESNWYVFVSNNRLIQ